MSEPAHPEFAARVQSIEREFKSVAELSRVTGIKRTTLANYVHGLTKPGTDELVALARAGKVSIRWLATGEGPREIREEAAHGGAFDEEELRTIITVVEEVVMLEKLKFSPEQKAALITELYKAEMELRLDQGRGMSGPQILHLIHKRVA